MRDEEKKRGGVGYRITLQQLQSSLLQKAI